MAKTWSDHELETLKTLLGAHKGFDYISRVLPGRSSKSCQCKAARLGLSMGRFWTTEEDDILKDLVKDGLTYKEISELIPGRTEDACAIRASTKGLTKQIASRNHTKLSKNELIELIKIEPSSNKHPTYIYHNALRLFGSWAEAQKQAGVRSKMGFMRPELPTTVYLVYFKDENLYKIGITQVGINKRFSGYPEYEIIDSLETNLDNALEIEKRVLSLVNKTEPISFKRGKTETFTSEFKINKITDITRL